jgi:integrase
VFTTSVGSAHNHSNLRNRKLYPLLERLGIEQTGFHAFRRFRVTHLRKNRAPEDLIRHRMGHADKSVTDGYSFLEEDSAYRKMVAESTGIGFSIPPIVQKFKAKEMEIAVAA